MLVSTSTPIRPSTHQQTQPKDLRLVVIICSPMGGKPNEPSSDATQTADLTCVDGPLHMPRPGQTGNYTNEGVQGAPGRKGAPLNPEPMPSGTSGGWWRKPPGGSGATDTEARQCKAARARYGWAGRHGTAVACVDVESSFRSHEYIYIYTHIYIHIYIW